MLYAHVENGGVTYRGSLPKAWRNVSGLNLSAGDDDYLKTLGWVPYVEVPVEIGADEVADGEDMVITETKVTSTAKKRDMTDDEKHLIPEIKEVFAENDLATFEVNVKGGKNFGALHKLRL